MILTLEQIQAQIEALQKLALEQELALQPDDGGEDDQDLGDSDIFIDHRDYIDPTSDPGSVTGGGGVDGGDGTAGLPGSARSVYPAVFDLYNVDVAAKTVKIRGYVDDFNVAFNAGPAPDIIATKKLFSIAGVHTAVANGSASLDTAMAVAGTGELFYLYIETTLSGPTHAVTIERSSTASGNAVWNDGGDFDPGVKSRIYQPLWWVEVSGGVISRALDLRYTYRSDRAGN